MEIGFLNSVEFKDWAKDRGEFEFGIYDSLI